MALSIQDKARFVRLASDLSPENLHCDGEISRAAAERKRKAIMVEWRQLEAKAGRKISESDAWDFSDEVRAHQNAERANELAAMPSNPLVQIKNPGVWTREGKTGSSAYYIWGPQHSGTAYQLFSEFAYRVVGNREKVGEYATLDEAVAAGEAFLATVTYEAAAARNPLWKPEIIKRELERLPVGYAPALPEMPPVTGFDLRVGNDVIASGVAADKVGEILIKVLVERGQHCDVTAVG